MSKTTILLSSINDVKGFVNAVSKYSCDVDLISGRYIVDAKSIMGIFSLDLTKPIEVQIEGGNDEQNLLEEIKPYVVQ
jgi:phosphocarrier protein HPr